MSNLWPNRLAVLLHRVRSHVPQGPWLQAEAYITDSLLRLLGEVQVQVYCRWSPSKWQSSYLTIKRSLSDYFLNRTMTQKDKLRNWTGTSWSRANVLIEGKSSLVFDGEIVHCLMIPFQQGARFDCLVRLISETDLVRLPNGLGENILLFLVQTVGRQLVEQRQYRPSRFVFLVSIGRWKQVNIEGWI